MCCGPQGEGDRAIATEALSWAVATVQLLSGISLLPWEPPSRWVSEVSCLCLVLNFFFPSPLGSVPSLPVSQLHCFPVKVIHHWFTVENCHLVGFIKVNWFSKCGSIQTKREGEMTCLLLYLPVVLGNRNPSLYLTHIRTPLLGFISCYFGKG